MRVRLDQVAFQPWPVDTQAPQCQRDDSAGGSGKGSQRQDSSHRLPLVLELSVHLLDFVQDAARRLGNYPPSGRQRRRAAVLLDEDLVHIALELRDLL
jgi:hypothetical protein